jgi:hypothetical protein
MRRRSSIAFALLWAVACGRDRDPADADGDVDTGASDPPGACLSGVPCVDDTQCVAVAGTQCNTALAEPECQTVRCNDEGSLCSSDSLCPGEMSCLQDRCGTCTSLPDGAVCVDGEPACVEPGHEVCGSACVDPSSDPDHCGSCGARVAPGAVCRDGSSACPDGRTMCDDGCVDLSSDADNCGACGNALADGTRCVGGEASCSDGRALCGDRCVDLVNDRHNCGACGVDCGPVGSCGGDGACYLDTAHPDDCATVCATIDLTCVPEGQYPAITYRGWCDAVAVTVDCTEAPYDSIECDACDCTFEIISCRCEP